MSKELNVLVYGHHHHRVSPPSEIVSKRIPQCESYN